MNQTLELDQRLRKVLTQQSKMIALLDSGEELMAFIDKLRLDYCTDPQKISEERIYDLFDKYHSFRTNSVNIGASREEIQGLDEIMANLTAKIGLRYCPLAKRKQEELI